MVNNIVAFTWQTSKKGAVKGFPVKRDQLFLFAMNCDCKHLKAKNCE